MTGRQMTLRQLSQLVGGRMFGSPDLSFEGVASLDDAGPKEISFVAGKGYFSAASRSRAGALLTQEKIEACQAAQVLVDDPRGALGLCLEFFFPDSSLKPGVHSSATVHQRAVIHKNVSIGPACVVGPGSKISQGTRLGAGVLLGRGVTVGRDCRLDPGVTLLDGVALGSRVRIQSRTVIGSEGFGYVSKGVQHIPLKHVGIVEIGDDVEIGAGCCIDRGLMGKTTIGRGTKIDNLVHIAHNVRIGEDCLIIAQVGISGSVRIGDRAVLAGKVGVAGHLSIGPDAVVAGASRVVGNVAPGAIVGGWPAIPMEAWRRMVALRKRLPRMWQRLLSMQKLLNELSGKGDPDVRGDPSHCPNQSEG